MSDKIGVDLSRLRDLIDKAGVSRQTIADIIGCDVSTVTKHYNGDRNITVDYVIKYSNFFNVSADYLLGLSSVQIKDEVIKFVGNNTGLSQETIEILNYYHDNGRNKNNSYANIINDLFKSETVCNTFALSKYEDYSGEIFDKLSKIECLEVLTSLINYINFDSKAIKDEYLMINESGKIYKTLAEYENIFNKDDTDLYTLLDNPIAAVKHSEIIEKILFDKVIDSVKELKKIKDGERDANHTQT